MTGRALLNLAETHLLEGLGPEERALTRWAIRDPAGFMRDQNDKTKAVLLDLGGEIGD